MEATCIRTGGTCRFSLILMYLSHNHPTTLAHRLLRDVSPTFPSRPTAVGKRCLYVSETCLIRLTPSESPV